MSNSMSIKLEINDRTDLAAVISEWSGRDDMSFTVTGEFKNVNGEQWIVVEEKYLTGYGSNHNAERGFYQFKLEGGRVTLADYLGADAMYDLENE